MVMRKMLFKDQKMLIGFQLKTGEGKIQIEWKRNIMTCVWTIRAGSDGE